MKVTKANIDEQKKEILLNHKKPVGNDLNVSIYGKIKELDKLVSKMYLAD